MKTIADGIPLYANHSSIQSRMIRASSHSLSHRSLAIGRSDSWLALNPSTLCVVSSSARLQAHLDCVAEYGRAEK